MFSSISTIDTLKSLYSWLFQSEMPIDKGLQAEKSSKSSNSLGLDIFQFFHKKSVMNSGVYKLYIIIG